MKPPQLSKLAQTNQNRLKSQIARNQKSMVLKTGPGREPEKGVVLGRGVTSVRQRGQAA